MFKTPTDSDAQNNEDSDLDFIDKQFDFTGVTVPTTIGKYKLGKTIGFGACSLVKKCQNIASSECKNSSQAGKEEFYACKIIPKIRLENERMKQSFESEIRIIQQLHHPGIVQLIELLKDENNFYVILEYCDKGDLFSHIIDNKKICEQEAKYIFKQILEALKYLQSMNVSHRDLKPENILFTEDNRIKISDFGLSKFLLESKHFLVRTPCGSPCYVSPECISGLPYDGKTTDVWSCGIILYTMLTGHLPWTKHKEEQLFRQIRRAEYSCPKYISSEAKLLINGLLTVDIHRRYTVETALKDPWFSSVPSISILNSNISSFVSMRKIDQFFDHEIDDESLISTLKIRKRVKIETVEKEVGANSQKGSNVNKKMSFFQRLKLRKSAKSEKSKIKSNIKKEKKNDNDDTENTISNNITSDNQNILNNAANEINDYFCGLKCSLSSPTLKLKEIQITRSFKNQIQKLNSDEYCDYKYINLL